MRKLLAAISGVNTDEHEAIVNSKTSNGIFDDLKAKKEEHVRRMRSVNTNPEVKAYLKEVPISVYELV